MTMGDSDRSRVADGHSTPILKPTANGDGDGDGSSSSIDASFVKEKVINLHQQKNTRLYDAVVQFVRHVNLKLEHNNNNQHLYNCFIRILNSFRLGQATVSEARQVIAYLLYDHKDLLKEFNSLLSNSHLHSASNSIPQKKLCSLLPIKKRIVPEETIKNMHAKVKVKERRLYQTDDDYLVKDHPEPMAEAFNKVIHKTDKAKEDEKGTSCQRDILVLEPNRRTRLIPCDFIIPAESSLKRTRINKLAS